MQDFLQHIDLDYYRSALLLVARADLQRLRQERAAGAEVESCSESPRGAALPADGAGVQLSPTAAR